MMKIVALVMFVIGSGAFSGTMTDADFKLFAGKIQDQESKRHVATVFDKKQKSVIRTVALKNLTKSKDKTFIPLFTSIIYDRTDDMAIRALALSSLLDLDKEGSDAVVEIAKDMFTSLSSPVNPAIKNSWLKFDEKEKPLVIELIGVLGRTKRTEVFDLLEIPMNCKETRPFCAAALGELGRPAIPYLLTLLGNKDVKVRKGACLGLAKAREKLTVPALLVVLKEEINTGVRVEAAKALANIGDKKALPGLEEAKKTAKFEEEKAEYVKAINAIMSKK